MLICAIVNRYENAVDLYMFILIKFKQENQRSYVLLIIIINFSPKTNWIGL